MLLQAVVIICGLITPRLIITAYGSGYNGITASVTQFLSIITLLRAGVGGVTRSSLYKPLAENNSDKISSIIKATELFMRKIAWLFLAYVIILSLIYPFILDVGQYGGWINVSSYVLILSIGTFAQYYFCISYQLLLTADQREYISNALQIIQTILNTIIVIVFVNYGASIHFVKLFSAVAFMITPIVLHLYVKKKYNITRSSTPDNSSLSQRWDAFAHNLSDFIHGNTDILVLTLLAGDIAIVSVYTVYYLVINGVKKIVSLCTTGLEAAFGSMIANNESDTIFRSLRLYEFFIFAITTILFTCVIILIVPFVDLYISGVKDADYHRPMFALIAIVAEVVYCIRIPYSAIVYAYGHYKQTRNGAIAEAAINLSISVVLVSVCSILGMNAQAIICVAIGTFVANAYRTLQFINYLVTTFSLVTYSRVLLRVAVMVIETILCYLIFISMSNFLCTTTMTGWIVAACVVFCYTTIVVVTVNSMLHKKEATLFWSYIKALVK